MSNQESVFKSPCLLFDNECPLCRRFKESLERTELSDPLYFYPIQDERLYASFPFIDQESASKEIHLILDPAQSYYLAGAQAVSHLILLNPKVKKFSWLIESQVGQRASSIFYRSVNKYRETLRKQCPKCRVKHSN